MAVTASDLLAVATSTDSSSYNPAGSITAGANRLVLAQVTNFHASPNEVTLTGGGLTWTKVRSDVSGGTRITLFRAMSATPGTATVTAATSPVQTATGWNIKIVELAGVETGGTNGSAAIQSGSVVYKNKNVTDGSISVNRTDGGPWDATLAFIGHDATVDGVPGDGFSIVGANASVSGWEVTAEFSPNRIANARMTWPWWSLWVNAYHISINAQIVVAPAPAPSVGVPWWDGLRIFVEVGMAAPTGGPGVWDAAIWDESFWGAGDTFVDVSRWVRSIQTRRRFARDVQAWETGEATVVLDNRDGRFSPSNLAGPYVAGGVTQIRPWRPLRIRFTYGGVTFAVYTGYAVSWTERYARPGADAAITVACVDEQARLAMFDGYEQVPIGGGETSGRRMHRILDNAGFMGSRNIATGLVTLQPTNLAQNAASDVKLVADSEGGAAWIEADGSFWFADKHDLFEADRSRLTQATFTGNSTDHLPMADVTPADAGDLLVNRVAFARENGTVVTATDQASRSLYGELQYARSDLLSETDTQVQGVADFYLARYKDPEERFSSIQVTPRTKPASLIPAVLGLRMRDRIRVVHTHPGGWDIDRDAFISGVSHSVTQGGNWSTTLELQSATPYNLFATSRWDVATWDGDEWFY